MTANQILDHHGHERAREQIRREHREYDGERQRREQIFRRTSQKDDRDEDDADGQCRNERRPGDLLCAIEDRPLDWFTQGEVAMDVFDLDGRVIDQNTDCQRETAKGHHVQRVAEQTQDHNDARIDNGIEIITINVLRQLPRKSRIIVAVSTFIVMVSIPLSILASLSVLSLLGYTLNVMTLGGLALAVGILVDDATVEMENIHRNLAQGKPIQRAILDGAQQIAVPAFVSTLAICIVFVSVVFLTGPAKYLFTPLGAGRRLRHARVVFALAHARAHDGQVSDPRSRRRKTGAQLFFTRIQQSSRNASKIRGSVT